MLGVEPPPMDAPPAASPTSTPADDDRPLAYLLNLLANVPDRRLTRGDLNKKLRTRAAELAGLSRESIAALLDRASARGHVQVEKTRRAIKYVLTDNGAAHLSSLRALLPELKQPAIRGKIIPPANDDVRKHRIGYLLLAVLKTQGQSLAETEATRHLDTYAREALELNAPTARQLLRELAGQGLLAASGEKRSIRYSLTLAGRVELANSDFPKGRIFPLSGETLNLLLEAAREIGKQFMAHPEKAAEPPPRAELERVILSAFEEFRRERHAVTGLVPIHEVRTEVRRRFGDAAARHDVFDDVVLELWRAKRIRLTSISDHAKATPEHLQDAIPGVGETLFYLEAAHAPIAV